jgi:TRAP-type mannitol/chloroaromatic compound transport system permease small subunit
LESFVEAFGGTGVHRCGGNKLKRFLHLIDTINEWIGRTCSWTIVALTILVVLEVTLRRFFGSPTIWNFEVTKQVYAFHALIVAGYAFLYGAHVSVDLFYQKLKLRTRAIFDIITYIIFFFPFMSIMLYQGVFYSADSWAMREKSWSVFSAPLYLIKTVIPLMAFLILIQGVAIFIRQVHTAFKGKAL